MLSWYRELSTGERRTFWGCAAGWALDAMDVQLFSFVLPAIMLALGVNAGQAGLLGTSALISSAVGGWIAGSLADRYGRVRILQFSILWYSVFTALSACATSFDSLLVIRTLQGLGFGGEWAAGAVLMGEIIRAEHRGKAVGCVQSSYAVGWFAAALLSTIVLAVFPPEYAWRAVFVFGLLPALLVIYIRRHVKEPPLFARAQRTQEGPRPGPFAIFAPGILRTTVLTSMLAAGVQGQQLRHHLLVAHLPADRAASDGDGRRVLRDGGHGGGVLRLSVQRVPDGCGGTAAQTSYFMPWAAG